MAEQVSLPTHSNTSPSITSPSITSPSSHPNGRVLSVSPANCRDNLLAGQGSCSPRASTTPRSPLRHILSLASRSGTGCPSTRLSATSPRRSPKPSESNGPRIWASSNKARRNAKEVSHSQTEELLDLIAEAQRQRMEDQRAPGPAVMCGSCCLDTSQDFYNMLIHYQSNRMEDQRCWMPDTDEGPTQVSNSQEEG